MRHGWDWNFFVHNCLDKLTSLYVQYAIGVSCKSCILYGQLPVIKQPSHFTGIPNTVPGASSWYQGSLSSIVNEAFVSTLHLAYHKFLACMRLSSDKQPSKLVVRMYPLSFLQLNGGGYEMDMRRIWLTALLGRWRRKLGIVTQTIINERDQFGTGANRAKP